MTDWQLIGKKKLFENPFRPVEEWSMLLPRNGGEHQFAIETSRDIVIVFGTTPDQNVVLITEYYIGEQKNVLTLIAGIVDHGDHRQTAEHELQEEAGCRAEEFVYLGSGLKGKYVTGVVHFYLAKNVTPNGGQALESTEDITVSFISLTEFRRLLSDGTFQGAYEIACAYRALDYLGWL